MENITKNIRFKLLLIIASIFLYTYFFSYLSLNYFYIITSTIETTLLVIVLYKLIAPYLVYFVRFMFNSSYEEYNKIIEKPRLLFHLIFIPISIIFYNIFLERILIHFNFKKAPADWYTNYIPQNIELSIYLSFFTISILFVLFTRTKQFENHLIPLIEEKLNSDKITLEFNEENDLKNLFDLELIGNNRCEITFENLELFASGQKMSKKANWIDRKGQKSTKKAPNKEINYGFIFDMLHENIIKGGIKNISTERRKLIMNLIVDNFFKGDKEIVYRNIDKSYTNWKPFE
jgi:hypothetical protein